jgi:hypothetical protein
VAASQSATTAPQPQGRSPVQQSVVKGGRREWWAGGSTAAAAATDPEVGTAEGSPVFAEEVGSSLVGHRGRVPSGPSVLSTSGASICWS